MTDNQQNKLNIDAFLTLILENIPDMIFVKDAKFRIVQANQNFLKAYPEDVRDTVIGRTTLEQYDEDERAAFLVEDKRALSEGFSEVEESIQFPDGERRVLLTRRIRMTNAANEKFVLGIGQDITELVQERQKSEAALSLLDTIYNTAAGAIIGLGENKQILAINDAGREILGDVSASTPFDWPDDICFLDVGDLQPIEHSHDPIERSALGLVLKNEVHLMARKTAISPRYVRVSSAPVQSSNSPLRCVVMLDDVSEAEKNRQSLERKSRLDALGQLTGGIAHDFNNLLNTLVYALELLKRDNLSERGRRSADAALSTIHRGSELTNRLLAFAKKQPARATSRKVTDIFGDLRVLTQRVIEAAISIDFADVDEDVSVLCDQGQIDNALLNLIINSRDAILNSGRGNFVRIEARTIDDITQTLGELSDETLKSIDGAPDIAARYVEISVTDNGPGMSDAVKARAVDPFFTTKNANSGTGLGLSMVYGFVSQSRGEFRIYSELDQGTTVRMYLPVGDTAPSALTDIQGADLQNGQGETILIVEDEPHLLQQMAAFLRDINYTVIEANSGREALSYLKDGQAIDLLLTDVVMPGGLGGFDVARLARENRPGLPVLYMSGYTGFAQDEMGEIVAPLLAKPSPPSIVAGAIFEALRNRPFN